MGCAAKNTKIDQASVEQEAVLGVELLQQGYPDKAKFWIQTALRQAPNDAVLWNAWAYWLEDAGKEVLANQAYHQALKQNNHLVESYNNYAGFLCRQHDFNHAMSEFALAFKYSNRFNHATVLHNKKHCYSLFSRVGRAVNKLR